MKQALLKLKSQLERSGYVEKHRYECDKSEHIFFQRGEDEFMYLSNFQLSYRKGLTNLDMSIGEDSFEDIEGILFLKGGISPADYKESARTWRHMAYKLSDKYLKEATKEKVFVLSDRRLGLVG